MFERLRAAIHAALDAAAPREDARDRTARMREAVLAARAALEAMRDGIAATDRALAAERIRLADAERRGRLAAGIQDHETVDVADAFAAKHRERVRVLERKLEAQRSELALAEQELGEMKAQLQEVERNRPASDAARSVEAAWRELETAGGSRPETDVAGDVLRSRLDRAAREALADQQLEALKRRMGKQ